MIIGTAGHIDHGKTTLVRALTGVDTDRLPEEKRRGITIDLGFAPLQLDGIGTVGIVDVPGHEAFVRTMVAGATGVDLALLVVAADDGVMPQTREHLAVLGLLGVRHLVVALTKCDLVGGDWLALASDDVRCLLAPTALFASTIVEVSAATGRGLDALRTALRVAASRVDGRTANDLFRLPVDRAFTSRGTGTVVSGTVWSGRLSADATVRLMPSNRAVRVRGLHAFGTPVHCVRAGERAAIALAGVDLSDVHRGAVLVQGDGWATSRVVRADVMLLANARRPVGARARVRLHLGTSDVGARIVSRDGPLVPGSQASVRIVTDEPIVARAGDRFVLRAESPAMTIGGGVILDPVAGPRARPWSGGPRTPEAALRRLLAEAGRDGVGIDVLPIRLGLTSESVLDVMRAHGTWRVGRRVLSVDVRESMTDELLRVLRQYHVAHPLDPGAPVGWLRAQLRAPDDAAHAVLAEQAAAGRLVIEQVTARHSDFTSQLDEEHARIGAALDATLEAAGREPPSLTEIAGDLSVPHARLMDIACFLARRGELVAVEPDRFYRADVMGQQLAALRNGMVPGHDYAASELRVVLGVSRKFLIPYLEYCDQAGFTHRADDGRRQRTGER
jgi:selenocysteine-specific elongation factor